MLLFSSLFIYSNNLRSSAAIKATYLLKPGTQLACHAKPVHNAIQTIEFSSSLMMLHRSVAVIVLRHKPHNLSAALLHWCSGKEGTVCRLSAGFTSRVVSIELILMHRILKNTLLKRCESATSSPRLWVKPARPDAIGGTQKTIKTTN